MLLFQPSGVATTLATTQARAARRSRPASATGPVQRKRRGAGRTKKHGPVDPYTLDDDDAFVAPPRELKLLGEPLQLHVARGAVERDEAHLVA